MRSAVADLFVRRPTTIAARPLWLAGSLGLAGLWIALAPLGASPSLAASSSGVRPAVERAVAWMATVPTSELRFDAAVVLSQIARRIDSPVIRRELARARRVADRDHDHPHRVLWDPGHESPAEVTAGWTVPRGSGRRAKPNDFVSEALHCARNGFRPQTRDYLCGPVRDGGGYYTTHALWALVLARERGCVGASEVAECIAALQAELLEAQPRALVAGSARDVDLFAERLLVLVLSGRRGPEIDGFARALLGAQRPDGSFAEARPDEPGYFAYHATGIAAWALAEWEASREGSE